MANGNGYSKWPSPGFVAVLLVYGSLVVFFAWGMQRPDLDRIWELRHELKIGKVSDLKKRDKKILDAAMKRHAELTRALLPEGEIGMISANTEGWIETPAVTVLRTPESAQVRTLELDVRTPTSLLPYEIRMSGDGWNQKLRVEKQGHVKHELPKVGNQPEIITLELHGQDFQADPSLLGLRVTFCCQGAAKRRQL